MRDNEVGCGVVGEVCGEGIRLPPVYASVDGRIRLAKTFLTVAIHQRVVPSKDVPVDRRTRLPRRGRILPWAEQVCPWTEWFQVGRTTTEPKQMMRRARALAPTPRKNSGAANDSGQLAPVTEPEAMDTTPDQPPAGPIPTGGAQALNANAQSTSFRIDLSAMVIVGNPSLRFNVNGQFGPVRGTAGGMTVGGKRSIFLAIPVAGLETNRTDHPASLLGCQLLLQQATSF